MTKLKVLVVEDDGEAHRVRMMFQAEKWEVVHDMNDADLVCFVGGEDVNPALYGQYQHPSTYINQARDDYEFEIYSTALNMGIPMVGICRGGQFLNVMNGGMMFQDVDGHNKGHHNAYIPGSDVPYIINSVHHQQMSVNYDVSPTILLLASETFRRIQMANLTSNIKFETMHYPPKDKNTDIEAVFYPNTRCLCFQPHPEYVGTKDVETRLLFFDFIDTYILEELQIVLDEKENQGG